MNALRPDVACQAFRAPRSRRRTPNSVAGRAGWRSRRGAAVVELAILAPLLVMLFVIATDFARVYYFSLTLTSSARAGALFASDPATQLESPFDSTTQAALADATNLNPAPVITEVHGTDLGGRPWVEVSAEYTFETITGFPGIPDNLKLTRTVRMYVSAITPSN